MFDMFTSRNVKKIFKYPLSRLTTMSDHYLESADFQICQTFVGHFGRNMSDLRVWSLIHLECTVYRVIYFWSHYIPWHTLIKDNFWNNSPSHDKLVLCLLWGNIRLHRVLKMCRRPAISPFTFTLSPIKNLSSKGFPTIFMFMWIVVIAFC